MKQKYSAPKLVEYGRLTELTLGAGGTKPDFTLSPFALVNNNCNASAPATACLVPS